MRLRLALVVLALIGLSDLSQAQTGYKLRESLTGFRKVSTNVYERIPDNTGMGAAGSARTWAIVSGKAEATDAVVISNGPVGALSVSAKGSIDKLGMATTVVSMFLPGWASIAVQAAKALYDQVRVTQDDAAGNLKYDPGTPPVNTQGYLCSSSPYSGQGLTRQAACTQALGMQDAALTHQYGSFYKTYKSTLGTCATTTTGNCDYTYTITSTQTSGCSSDCTSTGSPISSAAFYSPQTVSSCPASIDALNPANNVPAGMPVGIDGLCPTARYNHVAYSPTDAAAKAALWFSADQMLDALKKATEAGGSADVLPGAVTGPGSQNGSPVVSTTTDPTGTTTKTTTPKYDYTYTPTSITVKPGETVTTVAPGGATTTTTTSGGQPNGTTVNVPDFCLDFPERAGCKEVGQPPSQEDIQKENKDVNFAPEGGFGADNGSCPGLVHTVSLGNVDVFGLFCKFMSGIRFAVVGVAWIIGAMIFIGRIET